MRISRIWDFIILLIQFIIADRALAWKVFHNRHAAFSAHQWKAKPFSTRLSVGGDYQMKTPQFIFVGGKGGVGKTTSSSSMAIGLSDKGLKTLVISTDPAHSLGDSLAVDLGSGLITQVPSEKNLWGLELNVEKEYEKFAKNLQKLSSESLGERLQLPQHMFDDIGIGELSYALKHPPPGVDEVIALIEIFKYANEYHHASNRERYDFARIIVDTAPTGHTVRLFQIPEFFESVLQKVLRVKARSLKLIRTFKQMITYDIDDNTDIDVNKLDIFDETTNYIKSFLLNMNIMKQMMTDLRRTQFMIVTIPTQLAYEESARLINSLKDMDIMIQSMICNQIITPDVNEAYLTKRINGQDQSIQALQSYLTPSNHPKKYNLSHIEVNTIPYTDSEITSVFGLRYFHPIAHAPRPYGPTNPLSSRLFTFFGGKGGVGKTTTSSSYALGLSDAGYKTLLVSTDPAHSLSDIFRRPFTDKPTLVDRSSSNKDDPLADDGAGELWVMEIDPKLAIEQFRSLHEYYQNATRMYAAEEAQREQKERKRLEREKQLRQQQLQQQQNGSSVAVATFSMRDFFVEAGIMNSEETKKALMKEAKEEETSKGHIFFDLQDPPPGSDEVIALSKLVHYLAYGYNDTATGRTIFFDRIVIDTAPTGHTLRMLQLPRYLHHYIQTILSLESKLKFMINDENFLTEDRAYTYDNRTNTPDAMYTTSMTELLWNLHTLDEILYNKNTTEFTIVTIPTELGIAETKRLVDTLYQRHIAIRRIIINQVLPRLTNTTAIALMSNDSNKEVMREKILEGEEKVINFFDKVRKSQWKLIQQIRVLAGRQQVPLLEIPYKAIELRTVPGLRTISDKIMPLIDNNSLQ